MVRRLIVSTWLVCIDDNKCLYEIMNADYNGTHRGWIWGNGMIYSDGKEAGSINGSMLRPVVTINLEKSGLSLKESSEIDTNGKKKYVLQEKNE